MMWLIPGYRVLRQSAAPPGVYTAHAMNIQVDVKIDKLSTLNLVWVSGSFKILLTIIPCADA